MRTPLTKSRIRVAHGDAFLSDRPKHQLELMNILNKHFESKHIMMGASSVFGKPLVLHFSNARAPMALSSSPAGVQAQHHSRKDVRLGFAILRVFCGHGFLPMRLPLKGKKFHFGILHSRSAKCTFLR